MSPPVGNVAPAPEDRLRVTRVGQPGTRRRGAGPLASVRSSPWMRRDAASVAVLHGAGGDDFQPSTPPGTHGARRLEKAVARTNEAVSRAESIRVLPTGLHCGQRLADSHSRYAAPRRRSASQPRSRLSTRVPGSSPAPLSHCRRTESSRRAHRRSCCPGPRF